MKIIRERRLLFVLLVSTLVPLLALGLLSAVAVHRMGGDLDRQNEENRVTRVRTDLVLRCAEDADHLAAFLRGREADLLTLALLPRTPERYLSFYWNALGPVWARDGSEVRRIWVPLYDRVAALSATGHPLVVVRSGQVRDAGDEDPSLGEFARLPLRRILSLPPGGVWIAPAHAGSTEGTAPFSGMILIATPARGPKGQADGVVAATLDPRHLAAQLRLGVPGEFPKTYRRLALFFTDHAAVAFPAPEETLGPENAAFLQEQRVRVIDHLRRQASGVIGPLGPQEQTLAYSPLLVDAGPQQDALPVGGLLVLRSGAGAQGPGAPTRARSAARSTQAQIFVLTLAATTGVVLAALLVARRMTVPWTRLRDKARTVASLSGAEGGDAADEISRSLDTLATRVEISAGKLRASEERLREFFEMSPDGIAVADGGGRLLHFNRALCQMLRRSPPELATIEFGSLFVRDEDRERLLERLRTSRRLRNYELEMVRGDGSTFPAMCTLRLAEDSGTECLEVILRDVSELKEIQHRDREKTEALFRVYGELSQAHEALRRAYSEVEDQVHRKTFQLRTAYEALQASDRVKTEFLMKMSHELRTPLNCIIGYAEAMGEGLDGPVSEEQADSLERIAQSGQRLLRMIENLLDLSRLESGRMEFVCSETRVEEAVEDVIHQARSLVGAPTVRLDVSLEEPLPSIWADPDRLRQVLFNLVGNALKFTTEGSVQIAAREHAGGGVEVRVTDTGPGIPPSVREHIFEKFVQAPGANRSGAGLGLAISREIVEHMGGRIWVESEPGNGSTFAFFVPPARSHGQLSLPLETEEKALA